MHDSSHLLTRYPHIRAKLHVLWGTAECRKYLVDLGFVDRDHRQGFPSDILEEIHFMLDFHDKKYPEFIPPKPPRDHAV